VPACFGQRPPQAGTSQPTRTRTNNPEEWDSTELLGLDSGKEYWLPESTLARYFLITENDTGAYERVAYMNHFSITVLLSYIRNKVRYNKLREFLEQHAIGKMENVKEHCPQDAEALMLMLDLIVCPDVSDPTKQAIGAIFGLDTAGLADVQKANDHWFTTWRPKFNLGKELDAKRSREVY